MSTHNICFYGELTKLSVPLSCHYSILPASLFTTASISPVGLPTLLFINKCQASEVMTIFGVNTCCWNRYFTSEKNH